MGTKDFKTTDNLSSNFSESASVNKSRKAIKISGVAGEKKITLQRTIKWKNIVSDKYLLKLLFTEFPDVAE